MNELINVNVELTSLDIAEVTGKEHKNILVDIRKGLKDGYLTVANFMELSYVNSQNKKQPCYSVSKYGYKKMLSRYEITKKRRLPDVIYIISHIGFDGYYKIGVTSSLSDRLKAFDNASPLGVELIYKNKTSEAMKIETYIHKSLSDKNTNLEWFKLSKGELNEVISVIDRLDVSADGQSNIKIGG